MDDKSKFFRFEAHFKESASYLLTLNSSGYSISLTHNSDGPYHPLLYALLFYFMLLMVYLLASLLQSRMDSSSDDTETAPILRASRTSVNDISEPGPGNDQSSSSFNPATFAPATSTEAENALADTSVKQRSGKLLSLDVFRGFTIALMIFVNYGGGNYYFFQHAPWNGLTVADLVFPWFVWIMGVSMMFSFKAQFRREVTRQAIVWKIIKRSVILFSLGLVINGISNSNLTTFRIPGVLQRLGGCYLFVGIMEVLLFEAPELASAEYWGGWYMFRDLVQPWLQWSITIGLASIQAVITYVLPVPGCGRGYLGPGGLHNYGMYSNCTGGAAGYIDRLIFTSNHIYRSSTARKIYQNSVSHDPEGLLGYLTSILLLEMGVAAGRILITYDDHKNRVFRLLTWAVTSGIVGGVLCEFKKEDGIVPVNKNLWSLSYVLITASFAFILFSAFYTIIDWHKKWGGNPFCFAGYNSILLYVGHELMMGIFPFGWTPVGPYHGTYLLLALWGASLWMFIAYVCHRKQFYVSI
ncbi:hypothetical protein HAZT_HAZT001268 [Hyalella azteca]|uniref:Heparan-alpha-glucosaminide N-acetyltransferase catalytic domain-containing protein n=1 Tax=Hyalella azteca TaxID=294128 RepID=A0A6A0HFX8_HYAAZ|nr:hypothetical protein HAZT_HAZT001268 [Hyalella azteca]